MFTMHQVRQKLYGIQKDYSYLHHLQVSSARTTMLCAKLTSCNSVKVGAEHCPSTIGCMAIKHNRMHGNDTVHKQSIRNQTASLDRWSTSLLRRRKWKTLLQQLICFKANMCYYFLRS